MTARLSWRCLVLAPRLRSYGRIELPSRSRGRPRNGNGARAPATGRSPPGRAERRRDRLLSLPQDRDGSRVDPTEQAQLGRSGVWVSRLGLGMAALGDAGRISDDDAIAVIAATRSLGLRHVDTAAEYGLGLAERRLGDRAGRDGSRRDGGLDEGRAPCSAGQPLVPPPTHARRVGLEPQGTARARPEGPRRRGPPRRLRRLRCRPRPHPDRPRRRRPADAPVPPVDSGKKSLSSEPAAICDFSYDGMLRSFDESLARLGTDRVDLVFTHEPDLHERQAATSGYRALERLRSDGRATAIGVAINDPEALVRFADSGRLRLLPARWPLHVARTAGAGSPAATRREARHLDPPRWPVQQRHPRRPGATCPLRSRARRPREARAGSTDRRRLRQPRFVDQGRRAPVPARPSGHLERPRRRGVGRRDGRRRCLDAPADSGRSVGRAAGDGPRACRRPGAARVVTAGTILAVDTPRSGREHSTLAPLRVGMGPTTQLTRGHPLRTVILAGGSGSRLSEETVDKPKPMVEIGHAARSCGTS